MIKIRVRSRVRIMIMIRVRVRVSCSMNSSRDWSLDSFVLPATTTHRDIPQGTTPGPVPLTSFTEMSWLRQTVVVVVAKLCVR